MCSLLKKYGLYYVADVSIGEIGITDEISKTRIGRFIWIFQWHIIN